MFEPIEYEEFEGDKLVRGYLAALRKVPGKPSQLQGRTFTGFNVNEFCVPKGTKVVLSKSKQEGGETAYSLSVNGETAGALELLTSQKGTKWFSGEFTRKCAGEDGLRIPDATMVMGFQPKPGSPSAKRGVKLHLSIKAYCAEGEAEPEDGEGGAPAAPPAAPPAAAPSPAPSPAPPAAEAEEDIPF